MNPYEQLRGEVATLHALLIEPEPGIQTWGAAVRQSWKRIAELWRTKTGEADLQRDLVEALRAAVPKICPRCADGQGISALNFRFHAVIDSDGREVGCTDCRAAFQRAILARADAEIAAQAKGASDAE